MWTDRLGCLPFFVSKGDRINSKLVYAVLKINLIQKGSGGQRHHLPCSLRQIIAKIVSTLCTQELKLEMLTIQYTKGFCCLVPRTVLPSRHCPSAEEDDSWQVEASPHWQCGPDVLQEICVKGLRYDTSRCPKWGHYQKQGYGTRRLTGWCRLQFGCFLLRKLSSTSLSF